MRTLLWGKYNDRIISSFFRYDERRLANLIFHELFHAVFFIKDEVKANENLASFFARELAKEYFSDSDSDRWRLSLNLLNLFIMASAYAVHSYTVT